MALVMMMKIAIIEDDKNFAQVVDWKLETDTIIRFPEVENFQNDAFDVVLCDLRLVNTWGIETITELRKLTDLPIIVLTGLGGPYLSATDMQAMLDAGAAEVWQKETINDPTFRQMIEEVIRKHHGKPLA